jgi:hypothetical protein
MSLIMTTVFYIDWIRVCAFIADASRSRPFDLVNTLEDRVVPESSIRTSGTEPHGYMT